MDDRETIGRVAELADAASRRQAAAALAAHVGAVALFIFVEDSDVDALLPAPGLPQTMLGGSSWRALLERSRVQGLHWGEVAYPSPETSSPAVACSGSGVVLVFVGAEPNLERLEPIRVMLPLIASLLRAEQVAVVSSGELVVARQDARHASELAKSLDAARADLERQTKSLMAARTRAEEAMRAKNEFLAMLGHELRNPLAPIMTALEIMRMRGIASREQDILDRQVRHLLRLVDDLLDVARIAGGKVELRKQHLDVGSIVAQAVETASPLLEQKQQELVVDVPAASLYVDGDPQRLAQVFSNLLTNAAKYSDPRTRITVSASAIGSNVVVRVQDCGQGIEPEMLEAVFNLFVQQRQSIERTQGGLGLGLAIVKNLVLMHGGTVRVFSEGRGKGSEFVVQLPLSMRDVERRGVAEHTLGSAVASLSPHVYKRVLVVDDNQDAANLLSEALTHLHYEVRTAFDGPSALGLAADFAPDIALLDIGLPVMDGYALGRRLRELDPALRLVALTGYGQASDKAQSQDAGFDAHLVKPIRVEHLGQLMRDLLSNKT